MKKVTDLITISELSRLIGITRPTLYKYLKDYEAKDVSQLSYSMVMLFDFICSEEVNSKEQIYSYCINKFSSENNDALMDKIKMLLKTNDSFLKTMELIVNNVLKLDLDVINDEIKSKIIDAKE